MMQLMQSKEKLAPENMSLDVWKLEVSDVDVGEAEAVQYFADFLRVVA